MRRVSLYGSALVALVVGSVVMLGGESMARADGPTRDECLKGSEEGIALRDRGKLREARKRFVTCAADACPKAMRIDCARWLEDVEASLPTVVFGAKDARGGDIFEVNVFVDGEPITGHEQGKAVALDPGPHLVRFERTSASGKPFEERVLLRAGERNRLITAHFDDEKPSGADPSKRVPDGARDANGAGSDADTKGRGVPIATYVLGAIGIGALGSFGFFAVTGSQEKTRLRTACAPSCTDNDIGGLKTRYIVADISLGVGIIALGLATYFWLTSEPGSLISFARSEPASIPARAQRQRLARTIWK